jgi:hypothetical protein
MAVDRAAEEGQLQRAGSIPQQTQAEGNLIRTVGPRTFVLIDGVWTETTFDPQKMATTDLPFLSALYWKLADSHPDIAAVLALGNKLILVVDGIAYRVNIETSSETPTPQLSPTLTAPTARLTPSQSNLITATSQPSKPSPAAPGCPGFLLLIVAAVIIATLRKN